MSQQKDVLSNWSTRIYLAMSHYVLSKENENSDL